MPPMTRSEMIEAGSAALRKVMSNPLKRRGSEDESGGGGEPQHPHPAMAEDSINSIIEYEIIPRLLLAHSSDNNARATDRKSEIAVSEANRFATLPLELEAAGLLEEVDKFLAEGVSTDAIYIDLLALAARRLGEMWVADECDFVDVTMGLWRLQEVMRDIAARTPRITTALASPRSILVAAMPGDQHTFGAQMVEEVFNKAGWQSELHSQSERRELLDRLAKQSFDAVALTISRDCPSAVISSLIKSMRGISVNPHLSVLVGGNSINNNPALVAEVGADGTGSDARAALEVAEQLVMAAPIHAYELR